MSAEHGTVVACHDCGLAYGSEGWIECVVPNDVWAQISPTGDEGGILCITCINRRVKRAGLAGVPVMLCGTEVIKAAGQAEAFSRGWRCAEKRIAELERAFERNGQGLDDDIETVRYTIGHLKATGHDEQTYIYRDLARVLRNLETVRSRSGLADKSESERKNG